MTNKVGHRNLTAKAGVCIESAKPCLKIDQYKELQLLRRQATLQYKAAGKVDRKTKSAIRRLRRQNADRTIRILLYRKDLPRRDLGIYLFVSIETKSCLSLMPTIPVAISPLTRLAHSVCLYRLNRIRREFTTKSFYGYTFILVGGTRILDNEIVIAQDFAIKGRVTTDKKPKTTERHVGIELEFIAKSTENYLIKLINKYSLQNHVTLHRDNSITPDPALQDHVDGCQQLDDCECQGPYYGHELCVLATEGGYKNIVEGVCKMLEHIGATVNWTCGFHVHLDMRRRLVKKAFKNLVLAQDVLYKMQPSSRRKNKFCKPTTYTLMTLMEKNTSSIRSPARYLGVNPYAMKKHKTIEVRIHTGTINYEKIVNWVDTLIAIVNAPKIKTRITEINIAKRLKLPGHLVKYINNRVDRFKLPIDPAKEPETDQQIAA